MENPTLDLISQHASIRHYQTDALPAQLIEKVVSAGQCASTSSNLQLYSVIAVTDGAKRQTLAGLADHQEFISTAPVFLVWNADLARLERVCQLRGLVAVTEYLDTMLTAVMDATLAAQNTALAAESLGLGICYVGALRKNLPQVIELLELPRLVIPIFGMTLGWPAKKSRVKPRLPIQAILHWEKYSLEQDEYLLDYDRTMAESGIYTGRQVFIPGREAVIENYGWLEHTARRTSLPARTDLRQVCENQGLFLK